MSDIAIRVENLSTITHVRTFARYHVCTFQSVSTLQRLKAPTFQRFQRVNVSTFQRFRHPLAHHRADQRPRRDLRAAGSPACWTLRGGTGSQSDPELTGRENIRYA